MLSVDEAIFNFTLKVRERKTDVGIGARPLAYDHVFEYLERFTFGAGADKINAVYSRRALIPTGNPINVDLRNGLVSVLDNATPVLFPVVCGIFLKNLTRTPGQSLQMGAGSTPFASWISNAGAAVPCGPGGFINLWNPIDGYPTVLDTADILRFSATDQSVLADILILGRSS